jgi:nucleotide-binding universal stress UspA family protein
MSFAALAEGAGVRVTQFIDVGDTTEELKKRAVEADADLVVIAEAPSIISNLEPLVKCLILSGN